MLRIYSLVATLALLSALSCTNNGTLEVRLTDAIINGADVSKVVVNVSDVSVHTSASAGANDAGWTSLNLANNTAIDLLSLQNGINQILGSVSLPPGRYQQMRFTVSSATLTLADTTTAAVTIPSGVIKLNIDATIEANKKYGVILDFDAAASLKFNAGTGWSMNPPVVTVKSVYVTTIAAGGTCSALTDLCEVGSEKCCVTTSPTIKCIDIKADMNNCGGCGTVCTTGQTCTNGVCG